MTQLEGSKLVLPALGWILRLPARMFGLRRVPDPEETGAESTASTVRQASPAHRL